MNYLDGKTHITKLLNKRFDVLLLDPPWNYYGSATKPAAAGKHYTLIPDDEMEKLPIAKIVKNPGVVFLWATCPRLDFALECIKAWNLYFRGVAFVWIKTKQNGEPIKAQGVRPSVVKPLTELVLVASSKRLERTLPLASESVCQTVFAPRGDHSTKPLEVQERIEQLYPDTTKLEMFARKYRKGWSCWGDAL